jgi:hypothetical protein
MNAHPDEALRVDPARPFRLLGDASCCLERNKLNPVGDRDLQAAKARAEHPRDFRGQRARREPR